MKKSIFIFLIAILLLGLCLSLATLNNILTLNNRINTLQSDSVQSHKRIFQLTNQIIKDTTHKWCIKMQ